MANQLKKVTPKDIVKTTLDHLVYGISGISQSDKKDLTQSLTRVYNNFRAGKFLSAFIDEWKKLEQKGKIPDTYSYSEEHFNCLGEILDYLDNEIPNDRVFEVLKKLFFVSVMDNLINDDNLLPNQYLKIIKNLNSGEILVLFSIYRISKSNYLVDNQSNYTSTDVINKIAELSNLKHNPLVLLNCEVLEKKRLIHPFFTIHTSTDIRVLTVTDLGRGLCNYIERYDELVKD